MSSKGSILIFGLDGSRGDAGIPADKILAGIKKSVQDLKSAGWDADYFLFDHGDKEVIDKVATKLKKKQWDVVAIGAGVRLNPTHTGLFEDVTNAAVTLVKPPPRLVFQTLPESVFERLEYQFPEKS